MKEALLKLLESRRVVIPPMQRDYAHGRLNIHAESIRKGIVAKLKDVLLHAGAAQPTKMQLDYVFGKNRNDTFIPLDGQQRLTTLFLFYRYVIEATGNLEVYRETLAKFSYATRQSAREFSLALSENPILAQKGETLRIKGFSWFSEAWMGDPTVESMIVVLQEIHAQLKDADLESNFDMHRLEKCITFNSIMMDEWMMPDSEYITMNSTNLALTPWENFKAALVGTVLDNSSADCSRYKEKLDTTWTNAFFHDFKQQYDDRLFKFFYLHVSNLQLVAGCCSSDGVAPLPGRDYSRPIPYTPFERFWPKHLSLDDFLPLFALLDTICHENGVIQSMPLFMASWMDDTAVPLSLLSAKSEVTLEGRLVFHGCICLFKYLQANHDAILPHWMRVVWNIAENINLTSENCGKLMDHFDALAKHCLTGCSCSQIFYANLISYNVSQIKEPSLVLQLKEEKLKASLFGDEEASRRIRKAEKYELCRGKLAVFVDYPDGKAPVIDTQNLPDKVASLKRYYDVVTSPQTRAETLWKVYCTIRKHFSNQFVGKDNFEFPVTAKGWKYAINTIPEENERRQTQYKVWRSFCHQFIFAGETLECDIVSPDTFTDVLERHRETIFARYAQIWEWGSGWIRTRESGRTATSYCLDTYAELESALCNRVNLGYQYRLLYRVEKQPDDGTFMVTHNAQNKSHLVSLEQLQGMTYTSLQEYLNAVLPNILPDATP